MAYYKQGGSGNNWALGHKYLTEEVYGEVSERIQTMMEKQDYFQGFHVLKSLAGGTGSGLGAHLIEKMRDDHPKSVILNTAIWPYSTGEVILQNYNVLLTLASSLEYASGILPLYNDDVLSTCRHLLKQNRPSYKLMNTVIAQSLLSFLYPCASSAKTTSLPLYSQHASQNSYSYGPECILNEIDEHLLGVNDFYKLLTVKNIPQCSNKVSEFNSDRWEGMLQRIRQMLITNSGEHRINWAVNLGEAASSKQQIKGQFGGQTPLKSIGSMVFTRGDQVYSKENLGLDELIFGNGPNSKEAAGLYCDPTKLCKATGLRTYRDSQRLFGHEKGVCVLSNNQSHVEALERTLRKGTQMRRDKAFLHHYAKFGVDSEAIDQAFIRCEETLEAYKRLSIQ